MDKTTRTVLIRVDVAAQLVSGFAGKDPRSLTEEEIICEISDLAFFGRLFPNVFEDDIFLYEGEVPDLSEFREPVSIMEEAVANGDSDTHNA